MAIDEILAVAGSVSIVGILMIWLAASIYAQFGHSKSFSKFRSHDLFHLIPSWKFFAPNPATTDIYLFYRDRDSQGSFGPWFEMIGDKAFRCTNAIWNPGKRLEKLITDEASSLLSTAGPWLGKPNLLVHYPYVWLVVIAASAPHNHIGTHRQFLIANTHGVERLDEIEPLFVSNFHSLT